MKIILKLALIVCLTPLGACRSRVSPPGVPSPAPPPRPPNPAPAPSSGPTPPSAPVTAVPEDRAVDCALIPEAGSPITTVGLVERIDPLHAPYPSNDSERLLFRQLYETLLRVDCTGRVLPGLAKSWRLDPGRHTWSVTLRDNARFSDGSPVTTADVLTGWSSPNGAELRSEVRRLVRSIIAVDERTLEITLRGQGVDTPLALAHTDMAIARRLPGSQWPLGTRPARIASDSGTASRTTSSVISLMLLPSDSEPSPAHENPQSIRFLNASGRDTRDLLDEGVDLLLTRDPSSLNYAATLPQFASVTLAWQRTHVLLSPGRARTSRSLSVEERETLAHDAVRGEARGAQGPFWWQSLQDCEIASAPQPNAPTSTTGRIVYEESDDTARDLAERLVGLVRVSSPSAAAVLDALVPDRPNRTYQRATGLSGEALASARRRGNDAGYVMAFDRRPLAPCRDIQVLLEDLGWVDPETIVPLADTRLQAIVRRGHSGVIAEWDGGLLLAGGRQ